MTDSDSLEGVIETNLYSVLSNISGNLIEVLVKKLLDVGHLLQEGGSSL